MQYLDLSDIVSRHLDRILDNRIVEVNALAEAVRKDLSEDQKALVNERRLQDQILQMASDRFKAVRWGDARLHGGELS